MSYSSDELFIARERTHQVINLAIDIVESRGMNIESLPHVVLVVSQQLSGIDDDSVLRHQSTERNRIKMDRELRK